MQNDSINSNDVLGKGYITGDEDRKACLVDFDLMSRFWHANHTILSRADAIAVDTAPNGRQQWKEFIETCERVRYSRMLNYVHVC